METRIAVVAIIVKAGSDTVAQLNTLLSEYSQYFVGRMGIPYRAKGVNIISVVLDAPQDEISTLSGKIGQLPGITVKTAYAPADE